MRETRRFFDKLQFLRTSCVRLPPAPVSLCSQSTCASRKLYILYQRALLQTSRVRSSIPIVWGNLRNNNKHDYIIWYYLWCYISRSRRKQVRVWCDDHMKFFDTKFYYLFKFRCTYIYIYLSIFDIKYFCFNSVGTREKRLKMNFLEHPIWRWIGFTRKFSDSQYGNKKRITKRIRNLLWVIWNVWSDQKVFAMQRDNSSQNYSRALKLAWVVLYDFINFHVYRFVRLFNF